MRVLLALLICALAGAADAASLRERLTGDVLAVVMPGAERLGVEEGSPPSIAVYKGERVRDGGGRAGDGDLCDGRGAGQATAGALSGRAALITRASA